MSLKNCSHVFFLFQHKPQLQFHRSLRHNQRTKKLCAKNEDKKQNVSLNVGTIAVDKEPPDEIKLIVVPLKPSHLSLNLSDSEFETMGDKVGDSVDCTKKKVYKGGDAVKLLNQMKNHTNQTQG